MTLYFFDTYDGDLFVRDTEGIDLLNPEAARKQAHAALGYMAKDEAPNGDKRNLYVNVNDSTGRPIYTVCMAMTGRWLGQALG